MFNEIIFRYFTFSGNINKFIHLNYFLPKNFVFPRDLNEEDEEESTSSVDLNITFGSDDSELDADEEN